LFEPGSTAHVAGWFHGLKSARPGGPFHDRKEGLAQDPPEGVRGYWG